MTVDGQRSEDRVILARYEVCIPSRLLLSTVLRFIRDAALRLVLRARDFSASLMHPVVPAPGLWYLVRIVDRCYLFRFFFFSFSFFVFFPFLFFSFVPSRYDDRVPCPRDQ